ncbi:MAG TPA: helicase-related protein, partial [Novosphingobium sp.]|nr:helicase-related protein [Novosphingobium sp.]
MAVLGPTNTGKTHLAIERLCAHSSGAIGFPLRLLAREVYEKVCAIKGRERVALITGEERIEPPGARWLLCTAEAMPARADLAFMALDEVQLCADRERGHVFTDRLLNMRGREETMLLGSSVMEPMVKALVPEAEIISRPRFSTLSHAGAKKLSRIPPRSVIVAFSAEQVYAVAEMLRRFRGGAAVVMGALSPETRNKQVALYQAGEVDYLVATDAIGMGLNLDVGHVAFAGLSKFDGVRQRRLTPTEMAQIAGRAGRHQRDGTFGTLAGSGGHDAEFGEDEVFAIEEHRFAPLTRLFWREAEPRFDTLARLIADLEAPPLLPELAPAPQAIDLAVLKILAEDPAIARGLQLPGQIRRFWHVCSLPDFRNQGAETHARFVARLWEELSRGTLASDHAPRAISALDNTAGDIDTLQGRIAAIRSWAYICQRPDWVLNRSEMAERARGVEARLSDALHGRLTERFVNRRTTVLMRRLGPDAALLPVLLEGEDVLVEGEKLGSLRGFRFRVDPVARLADQKLLLAAAEKHLPQLLAVRAQELIAALKQPAGRRGAKQGDRGQGEVALAPGAVLWRGEPIARLEAPRGGIRPQPRLDPALERVPPAEREALAQALAAWLGRKLGPLAPLARLEEASRAEESGPELRALLIRLVEAGGVIARAGSGVDRLDKGRREGLRRLGVKVGALDLFVPAMVQPAALRLWAMLAGRDGPPPGHAAVLEAAAGTVPFGYRRCARQWLRVDVAEGLLRGAHALRMAAGQRAFVIDPEPALAQGITTAALAHLLREAGFRASSARRLAPDEHGP